MERRDAERLPEDEMNIVGEYVCTVACSAINSINIKRGGIIIEIQLMIQL
jgi:hypothetical protein